jgi:spermidine synthase
MLLLGVAGGSVIATLRNDFSLKAKITGIEIDPIAIQLANEFFNLEQITNTSIIQDDAFSFLTKTPERYDLIIVDLFNDKQMPEELFQDRFWENLKKIVTNNGIILFNTMVSIDGVPDKNKTITPLLHSLFSSLKIVKSHNKHNAVFVIKN